MTQNDNLREAVRAAEDQVPLGWVSSHPGAAYANFGDALSPVVVAAISGLRSVKRAFDRPTERLIASGTIIQEQTSGFVHVWGSGVDRQRNAIAPGHSWHPSKQVKFKVHAVRGPRTRTILAENGVHAPDVFGDPGWLLPRILPPSAVKKYELGVIVHLSELESLGTDSRVASTYNRYQTYGESHVKIISTLHTPSWSGFKDKVAEITSCRRIASTSFHGLIVPESYGIPSMYFSPDSDDGAISIDLFDPESNVDHRIRDFYLGSSRRILNSYGQLRSSITDWDGLIDTIDNTWEHVEVDHRPFFDSFPLEKQVDYMLQWPLDESLMASLIW